MLQYPLSNLNSHDKWFKLTGLYFFVQLLLCPAITPISALENELVLNVMSAKQEPFYSIFTNWLIDNNI